MFQSEAAAAQQATFSVHARALNPREDEGIVQLGGNDALVITLLSVANVASNSHFLLIVLHSFIISYTLLPVGLQGPFDLFIWQNSSVDLHFDHLANVNARLIGKQTGASSLSVFDGGCSPRTCLIKSQSKL